MPDLAVVDLSWAGRLRNGNPSTAAIVAACVGDQVRLLHDGQSWMIENQNGVQLARMAKAWSPPDGRRFVRGTIGAVIIWKKTDNAEEYRAYILRERWEVVLPELVFE
ncbi:hypothetical protein D9M69_727030 [compost metagenome]